MALPALLRWRINWPISSGHGDVISRWPSATNR